MTVIAMTREMGSRGREVAQGLAERLGLTLVLHELVERDIAQRLQVPERAVHHRFEGGASLREWWTIGTKQLAKYAAEEILDLARKGNVLIRGWGACVVLRDMPHVARIRVCAPIEFRQRNIMQRRCLKDIGAARREVETNDAAHKQALQAAYGVDRDDPLVYDLVLNTERLSIDTCVKVVADLVDDAEFKETEASRAILEDKLLEAHIRIKLGERFTAGAGVSDIRATVRAGKVLLYGVAVHTTLAHEAGKLIGTIPGVKDVENRIGVVRGPRGL